MANRYFNQIHVNYGEGFRDALTKFDFGKFGKGKYVDDNNAVEIVDDWSFSVGENDDATFQVSSKGGPVIDVVKAMSKQFPDEHIEFLYEDTEQPDPQLITTEWKGGYMTKAFQSEYDFDKQKYVNKTPIDVWDKYAKYPDYTKQFPDGNENDVQKDIDITE